MKKLLITIVGLTAWTSSGISQDLDLISGGGTYTLGATHSISWSLGEVVINTATGGANAVTQGFQQGNMTVSGLENIVDYNLRIFPNPATEIVTIESAENVLLSVFDMSGRLVYQQLLTDSINQLDVTNFSRGTYNLVFEGEGHAPNTAKLVVQ